MPYNTTEGQIIVETLSNKEWFELKEIYKFVLIYVL